MPCLARDPPHAISIFLYSREQKANITDLDHSFLKSDAKVIIPKDFYNINVFQSSDRDSVRLLETLPISGKHL